MAFETKAPGTLEYRRVFLVDDDEITRTALHFMLADGYETHELPTIEAAIAKGRRYRPDAVLVSALEVARSGVVRLHQMRAAWPGVKLLIICEAADEECRKAALHAGADDTLARPFKVEPVRRRVDRQLNGKVDLKMPAMT